MLARLDRDFYLTNLLIPKLFIDHRAIFPNGVFDIFNGFRFNGALRPVPGQSRNRDRKPLVRLMKSDAYRISVTPELHPAVFVQLKPMQRFLPCQTSWIEFGSFGFGEKIHSRCRVYLSAKGIQNLAMLVSPPITHHMARNRNPPRRDGGPTLLPMFLSPCRTAPRSSGGKSRVVRSPYHAAWFVTAAT